MHTKMLPLLVVIAAGIATAPLEAAIYTYTPANTTTDQWSSGTHWSTKPISSSSTELTFIGNNAGVPSGLTTNANNNNNVGAFQLNILDLQGTGTSSPVTIAISGSQGSSLNFISNGATTPVVNLNSQYGVTYNVTSNVALSNNTLFTGNGFSTFNFSGTISGAGQLTKSGISPLYLLGQNTYSGGTVLNGGNLVVGRNTSLGTGALYVMGNAALSEGGLQGTTTVANAIDVADGKILSASPWGPNTTLILSGTISDHNGSGGGTGGLAASGFGTLILTANNTYTGTTSISSQTVLQIGNGGSTGSVAGNIVNSGILLVSRSDAGLVIANPISGAGGVAFLGTGTTTLAAANTYGGGNNVTMGTDVANGTLLLDFSAASSPTSNIINSSTNKSSLHMDNGTLALKGRDSTATSQRFAGLYVDAGASAIKMIPNGASSITLNVGAVTRAQGGMLNFDVPAGGQVITSATNDTGGLLGPGITINGNDWARVSGSNVVATSYTIANDAATWTTNQNISNTSSGTNAYTGTLGANVAISSLKFDNASQGTVTIAAGNALTINDGIMVTTNVGNNQSVITGGTLQGSGNYQDLVVINNNTSGSLTIGSVISNATTGYGLTKGGAGTLVLTAANTYGGDTFIYGGLVQLSGSGTLGSGGLGYGLVMSGSGSGLDLGGRTQGLTGLTMSNGSYIQSTGGSSVLQMGSAIVNVNGTGNTIGSHVTLTSILASPGNVNVNGNLKLDGTISRLNVNVSGILGGSGTVSATSVTVYAGGSTYPGMSGSAAKLTLDLTYEASSTAQFQVNNTRTPDAPRKVTAGVDYDQIVVTGSTNPVLTIGTSGSTIQPDGTSNSNVQLKLNLGANALAALQGGASGPYSTVSGNVNLTNYFLFQLGTGTSNGYFQTLDLNISGIDYVATIYYSGTNDRFNGTTGLGDVVISGLPGAQSSMELAISYLGDSTTNSTIGGNDIVLTVVIPEPATWAMIFTGFLIFAASSRKTFGVSLAKLQHLRAVNRGESVK